jgi:hypothetical protein
MAKSDFICSQCKEVKGPEVGKGGKYKWECPRHKTLCDDHIKRAWFAGDKCKECDNKVIRREFKRKAGKWQKV